MHPLNENKERGNTRGVNFRSQTGIEWHFGFYPDILFYPIIIDHLKIYKFQTASTNYQKTLPKALRTQVLTALTSNFGFVALVQ